MGTANVFLQSLAYALDFADEVCIVDHKVSDIINGKTKSHPMGKILTITELIRLIRMIKEETIHFERIDQYNVIFRV